MLWNVRTDTVAKTQKINYNVSTQGFFQSANQATDLFPVKQDLQVQHSRPSDLKILRVADASEVFVL